MSESGASGGAVEDIVIHLSTDVGNIGETIEQLGGLKDLIDALKSGPTSPTSEPFKDLIKAAIGEYYDEKDEEDKGLPSDMVDKINELVDNVKFVAAKLAQSVGISTTVLGFGAKKFERSGQDFTSAVEEMVSTVESSKSSEALLSKMNLPSEITPESFKNAIIAAAADLPTALGAGLATTVLDQIGGYMMKYQGSAGQMAQEEAFLRLLYDRWMEMISGAGGRESRQEHEIYTGMEKLGLAGKRQAQMTIRQPGTEEKSDLASAISASGITEQEGDLVTKVFEAFGITEGMDVSDMPGSIPGLGENFIKWLSVYPGKGTIKTGFGETGKIDVDALRDIFGKNNPEAIRKIFNLVKDLLGYKKYAKGIPDLLWREIDPNQLAAEQPELKSTEPGDVLEFVISQVGYEVLGGTDIEEFARSIQDPAGKMHLGGSEVKVKYTIGKLMEELDKRYRQGLRKMLLFTEIPGEGVDEAMTDWLEKHPDAKAIIAQSKGSFEPWFAEAMAKFKKETMQFSDVAGIGSDIIKRASVKIPELASMEDLPRALNYLIKRKGLTQEEVVKTLSEIAESQEEWSEKLKAWISDLSDRPDEDDDQTSKVVKS